MLQIYKFGFLSEMSEKHSLKTWRVAFVEEKISIFRDLHTPLDFEVGVVEEAVEEEEEATEKEEEEEEAEEQAEEDETDEGEGSEEEGNRAERRKGQ
jgi:hypothetical protein